jgi:hypothetical protein
MWSTADPFDFDQGRLFDSDARRFGASSLRMTIQERSAVGTIEVVP